jgi:hypothetical protein
MPTIKAISVPSRSVRRSALMSPALNKYLRMGYLAGYGIPTSEVNN